MSTAHPNPYSPSEATASVAAVSRGDSAAMQRLDWLFRRCPPHGPSQAIKSMLQRFREGQAHDAR